MRQSVRVRFAPSPTGQLHIGNFRTALFNWLFARHNSGAFLVRIEDTDLERSKQEYVDTILATLQWAGIAADEDIIIQSQRVDEHTCLLEKLIASGHAYRCYCSPDELTVRVGEDFNRYDERCRSAEHYPNKPYVIRFKIPDMQEFVFEDLIRGKVVFQRDQLDDFIIARSDGSPVYNFVVVADDIHMKITHIIRGEDHISNTPKQILLYLALGAQLPQFAHLPLILGPSGERLSKRDAATAVIDYKKMGYLPQAFINYLARLGWAHGDQEIFSIEELIKFFTLEAVGKKGSIFDLEKLNWVNSVYIKEMDTQDLMAYIIAHLDPNFMDEYEHWSRDQVYDAVELYKERAKTIRELMAEVHGLYTGPQEYNQSDYKEWITPETPAHLERVISLLDDETFYNNCLDSLKKLAKDLNIKIVQLMQPLRLALIGKSSGPGVCQMIEIIGQEGTAARLRTLIDYIQQ